MPACSQEDRDAVYARPESHWKVFVSSKMRGGDLRTERVAAVSAVEEFALTRAWSWEQNAHAGPYCSKAECVGQARTSDALILILGDDLTETTRLEYEAAYQMGAPVFVMLKAGVERSKELDSFVRVLRKRGVTANFSNPGELASLVTEAIRSWAVRLGRIERSRVRAERAIAPAGPSCMDEVEIGADPDGEMRSVAEFVEAAKAKVAGGASQEALEELWEALELARGGGLVWLAAELLDVIDAEIPPAKIDSQWQGWLFNARGLIDSDSGNHEDAARAFGQMWQIGRQLQDLDLQATALQNLGICDAELGRYEQAAEKYAQSIELKRQLGDLYGSLQVLSNMVNILVPRGRLDEADALVDDMFKLVSRHKDPEFRNTLHGHRGIIATKRGDHEAARAEWKLALRAARRAGSIPRQITTLQNLGSNAVDRGKPREGAAWYGKALALAEGLHDVAQRRRQRAALALSLMRSEEFEKAAELFELSAADAEELGDNYNQAVATGDVGACWLKAGEVEKAIEWTERALRVVGVEDDIWRAGQLRNLALEHAEVKRSGDAYTCAIEAANLLPDWEEEASALAQAAEIAISSDGMREQLIEAIDRELELRRRNEKGAGWAWRAAEFAAELRGSYHHELALTYFAIALRSFAARGELRQVFFIRNDRSIALGDLGRDAEAAEDLRRCLRIATRLDDRVLSWQAHRNFGEIERRAGHLGKAQEHLGLALAMCDELDDPDPRGEVEALLGLLEIDAEDLDSAEEHFAAAARDAKLTRSPSLSASAMKGQGHVAFLRRRFARAAGLYRRASRALGDEVSRQKAESLNGVIHAEARRGRIAEAEISELDRISLRLRWDSHWVDSLRASWIAMLEPPGSFEDGASLAALLLLISMRASQGEPEEDGGDGDIGPRLMEAYVSTGMVYRWIEEAASEERRATVIRLAGEIAGSDGRKTVAAMLSTYASAVESNAGEDGGPAP